MFLLGGVAVLWLMLGAGCEFKGGEAAGSGEAMAEFWRPEPASLRVYPSTRYAEAATGVVLEARIELRDEMGDAVKAAGRVGLELVAADEAASALDRRLYRWDVTMRTLADQRDHFDSVTRTYVFRLELDEAAAEKPAVLRVTFTRASDGRRLSAEAPIQQR